MYSNSTVPDAVVRSTTRSLPAIGIGAPYMPAMPMDLYQEGHVDFVEITPETLCREQKRGDRVSLELVPNQLRLAMHTCGHLPMAVHGVQLSIGSAHGWNESYLNMLERLQEIWPFLWHSEHLGFQTILDEDQKTVETGVPLPMPNTAEAANLIIERCDLILKRFGVPFLLENPAHYLDAADTCAGEDSDLIGDEIQLMNRITGSGQCAQLLDLHNLYCNAVNHDFDPYDALDRLALDRVTEIHIAGGSWQQGFLMDAHDNIVPHQVWDLLEYTLPRAPRVAGVVYEVLDRYANKVGVQAMKRELAHARTIWNLHRKHVDAHECVAQI